MTTEREKMINEWLDIHCPKCTYNDDRGTEFLSCQAECEVQKDVGIACIHYEEYRAEQEPCEDAISREDAIMALTGEWTESRAEILPKAIRRIKALPSVQPEPKTGHWIEDEYEMKVWCSNCDEENGECSKYCPNCGAKMVESEDNE